MQLVVEIGRLLCDTLRGDVGVNQLLPIAYARKNVRRHVQGMGRSRRDFGIAPGGLEPLLGDRRIIVEVDQIMRDAGCCGWRFAITSRIAAPLSWLA